MADNNEDDPRGTPLSDESRLARAPVSDELTIKQLEGAKLLWEEFKYRHEFIWKSAVLWGAGLVAVAAIPYAKPAVACAFASTYWAFPLTVLLGGLLATWHLYSEYRRLDLVNRKLKQISWTQNLATFEPGWMWSLSMGRFIALVFLTGSLLISAVDLFALQTWLEYPPTCKRATPDSASLS